MTKISRRIWNEPRQAWIVALLLASPSEAANYNNSVVNNGDVQNIHLGDPAINVTINDGGMQNIHSGGVTMHDTINFGGKVNAVGGNSILSRIMNGGVQTLSIGGSSGYSEVNSGGKEIILSDSAATFSTINDGGEQDVETGGWAISSQINSGGNQYITGGAQDTLVESGGWQHVNKGGTASATVVSAGGTLHVLAGGMAKDVDQKGGGSLITSTDATVSGINAMGTFSIKGNKASHVLLEGQGVLDVLSGGDASSSVVNAGGTQNVASKGSALSTTVNSKGLENVEGQSQDAILNGGTQSVYFGGVADLTTVNSDGNQNVHASGYATSTTVNQGGWQNVESGGLVADTTVNNSGSLNVAASGTALDVTQFAGAALITNTSANVRGANALGAFEVDSSSGSAYNVLLENGGTLRVWANHQADETTVRNRGFLIVEPGGVLTGTTTLENGSALLGNDIINNGNLYYLQNAVTVWQGDLSGTGKVTQEGGNLTLGGSFSQDGGIFLTKSGVMTLSNLQAQANVTASTGTSLKLSGVTQLTGVVNTTAMNVERRASWNITGDSTLTSLTNAGTINMLHTSGNFTPQTLTTQNLTDNNGTVTLHSVLGDSFSPSDRIVIDSGIATGNTTLQIINHGGLGVKTTGDGILVVQAVGGGTTNEKAFSLLKPVDAGAWRYTLYRNANENWYLSTETFDTPNVQPVQPVQPPIINNYSDESWLYPSLSLQAMNYDRQVLGDKDSRRTLMVTDPETGLEIWGRMRTGHLQQENGGATPTGITADSHSNYSFIQIGSDLHVWNDWRAGIYGAVGADRGSVRRGDNGQQAGNVDDTIYSGGAYLNGVLENGFYSDNVIQLSHHEITASAQQGALMSTSGTGVAISVEGGWAIQVLPKLVLEPQLQYVWQNLNLNNSQSNSGTLYQNGDSQLHQLRAGVRVGNTADYGSGNDSTSYSFWVKPTVIQNMGSRSDSTVGATDVDTGMVNFSPNQNGTALAAEAGADINVGTRGTLGARGGYTQSLQGGVAGGYYGQLNLKVTF